MIEQTEMDAIEEAFLKEREEMLNMNKSEIEDLFDRRRQKELAYMKAKQDREEEYQKEMEQLLLQASDANCIVFFLRHTQDFVRLTSCPHSLLL